IGEQQSGLLYNNNDFRYKPSEQTRDPKQIRTPYNYRSQSQQEYKGDGFDGDYGSRKLSPVFKAQQSMKYEDSLEAKLKQKENAKQMYESKPEYDYDSSNSEPEDEDIKTDDNYNINQNKKTPYLAHNINNNQNRKNQLNGRGFVQKQEAISPYYYNRESGQSLPPYNAEPFDGWPNYYYKANANNWPQLAAAATQIQETIDGQSILNLYNGYRNQNKESVRSALYSPAYDLMADTQLKAASNPVPMQSMQNSKIYAPYATAGSTYQPINLFAGYGRDYSLVDLNGELYPAPLVSQKPPRQLHKPLHQSGGDLAEQ
ncbi:unnamed protein product, partial [Medioppia subpectinata]